MSSAVRQKAKQLDPHLAALVDLLAEFVVDDFFRELETTPSPTEPDVPRVKAPPHVE